MQVSSATLALQILQQPAASATAGAPASSGAAANATPIIAVSATKTSAQTADALFDVSTPNLNKMKMDLYKRVGEALGLDESAFDSPADYGKALKFEVAKIKLKPNADQIIAGVEKDLGLDKLGVSLDAVINAIIDPRSDDAQKLNAALKAQIGDNTKSDSKTSGIRQDDTGIYAWRN